MKNRGEWKMVLQIGICDDEQVERDYVQSLVQQWAKRSELNVVITTFTSGENFLFHYEEKKDFHILLLDIQMNKIDGIQLAKQIRQDNEQMQIIFITGFADFMSDGYDVSALHYLMKPVKEEKLFKVLTKASKGLENKEKALFIIFNKEQIRLLYKDILYIESQGHYVLIKAENKEYKVKKKLADLCKELDQGFFRCQRSYIVGLRHVIKVTRKCIYLENNIELPLSRGLYEDINQGLISYFQ